MTAEEIGYYLPEILALVIGAFVGYTLFYKVKTKPVSSVEKKG